jgi:hypothetical protein
MKFLTPIALALMLLGGPGANAFASDDDTTESAFTGPLLTPDAEVLSQGKIAIEPYLIFGDTHAAYDTRGHRHARPPASRQWLLSLPATFGVTDRLNAQLTVGTVHNSSGGERSQGERFTDTTLMLQYMLLSPGVDGMQPAISVAYTHTFPTGSFDHLDANLLNGSGGGASVHSFSTFIRLSFGLPNDHTLRWYTQFCWSPAPARIAIQGMSVYDTPSGFRGFEHPGRAISTGTALEYDINLRWAIAMELTWDHQRGAHLRGTQYFPDGAPIPMERDDASHWVYSVTPAIEYKISEKIGLLAGAQISIAGRRNDGFVNPQIALNVEL